MRYLTYHNFLLHLILDIPGFNTHFHSRTRTHWHTIKIRTDIRSRAFISYMPVGLYTNTSSHFVSVQVYISLSYMCTT